MTAAVNSLPGQYDKLEYHMYSSTEGYTASMYLYTSMGHRFSGNLIIPGEWSTCNFKYGNSGNLLSYAVLDNVYLEDVTGSFYYTIINGRFYCPRWPWMNGVVLKTESILDFSKATRASAATLSSAPQLKLLYAPKVSSTEYGLFRGEGSATFPKFEGIFAPKFSGRSSIYTTVISLAYEYSPYYEAAPNLKWVVVGALSKLGTSSNYPFIRIGHSISFYFASISPDLSLERNWSYYFGHISTKVYVPSSQYDTAMANSYLLNYSSRVASYDPATTLPQLVASYGISWSIADLN